MSAQTHSQDHEHEHGDEPHVLPLSLYLGIWGALVVLTIVTLGVAQIDFADYGMPGLNTIVAMFVATIKGSLVALYFMHLRYDNKLNLIILLGSLMLVGIFFYPTLTDVTSRGNLDGVRDTILGHPQIAAPSAPAAHH